METMFKVIAKDSRTGSPYVIENLTLNFQGKAAKIRAPRDMTVNIGDSVRLELSTVRGYGVAQIGAIVKEVIPQEKKGE